MTNTRHTPVNLAPQASPARSVASPKPAKAKRAPSSGARGRRPANPAIPPTPLDVLKGRAPRRGFNKPAPKAGR